MLNAESFINSIALLVDIQDLKKIGLTEEEIEGYIDFFCDNYSVPSGE